MQDYKYSNAKFSLLCPTRERLDLLENLIESLINTTHNICNIEVLFAVDNDDKDTINFINYIDKPFVKLFVRERSEWNNRDYYNWLASFSSLSAKYLFAIGNDVEFKVDNWDKIAENEIERYLKDKTDRILCTGLLENGRDDYAWFPIITIETYLLLGYFLPPELPSWGADTSLSRLFKSVNRYFVINDRTYLNHVSVQTNTRNPDNIYRRTKEINIKHKRKADYYYNQILPREISKLKYYLK